MPTHVVDQVLGTVAENIHLESQQFTQDFWRRSLRKLALVDDSIV